MIGIMAQAVVDAELNDVEAMSILGVLIAAGGESTTSLTGTGVRILAEQLDLQERLRADPSLVPAFVEEACRFDPPFRATTGSRPKTSNSTVRTSQPGRT